MITSFVDTFGFCSYCKYKNEEGRKCKAYPNGIPDAIIKGKIDHTKPYPGDNGIQFEVIK